MNEQPHITTLDGNRRFACFPAAVLAILVNKRQEVLLMAPPDQRGRWQVVNGAMEAGETALDAALRESFEEAGSSIQIRPLGTVHISTFHYDKNVRYMLSISYLFAYEGGDIIPGDDMAGSEYRWFSLNEIMSKDIEITIPPNGKWIISRAMDLYHLWSQKSADTLPGFNLTVRGKN